ncbi:MAG: FadR family transcriptional regulator [Planctomycetota bacterium]|jgi:GntR family transcriptional repressor for pyruvate dehydrogenase complex|nr:FadR family transcriptional regulator [Planctomycetota bacterium]
MLKKVSKNTVAAQVINQITDLVKGGSVKRGERLPSEREMAEQLGVSRPPLREALRALEYAGIIETRYGEGIFVKSTVFPSEATSLFSSLLNQYTLEEMIEMRKIVETAAVRLAIQRATTEDLFMLQVIHNRAQRGIDSIDTFVECDLAFHFAIAEVARNAILLETVQTMRNLMSEFNHELLSSEEYRVSALEQHGIVCDAISRRDVGEAVAAMERHLGNVIAMSLRQQLDHNRKTTAKRVAVNLTSLT